MNFKGHLFLGILGSSGLLALLFKAGVVLTSWQYVIVVTLVIFFGLFPDIDTSSVVENFFYFGMGLVMLYLIYLKNYFLASIIGLFGVFIKAGKHRGITHSFAFFIVVSLPFFYYDYFYGISVLTGFFLHKIGDL